MDAHQYEDTPFVKVARNWAAYMTGTVEFKDLLYGGVTTLGPFMQVIGLLAKLTNAATHDNATRRVNRAVSLARHQIDNDFATVNRAILVDAWGAFEAFVEDAGTAALVTDWALLDCDPLKDVHVDQALLKLGEQERAEKILTDEYSKINGRHKKGFRKLEARLNLASLKCDATDELKRAGDICSATPTCNCPQRQHC